MYRIETHLHTKNNSDCGKETPEKIIEIYSKAGYNGIVVTNHFNRVILNEYLSGETIKEKLDRYLEAYYELKKLGKEKGIDVFFGVEFALQSDDYHNKFRMRCTELLVYGITPEDFLKYSVELIEMDYKEFYDLANNKGWILIQAHPYRERTKRINPHFLHGYEVFNGHPHHIARNNKAKRRAVLFNKIMTAGSDFHFEGGEGTGMIFSRAPADEADLVSLLKTEKSKIFHK